MSVNGTARSVSCVRSADLSTKRGADGFSRAIPSMWRRLNAGDGAVSVRS
jgi:hypothetical protein